MAGELGIDAATAGVGGAMAPVMGGALEGGFSAATAIGTPDINIGVGLGPDVAGAFGGAQNLGPDIGPIVSDLNSSLAVNPNAGIHELAGTDVPGAENLQDLSSLPGENPSEGSASENQTDQAPLPEIILSGSSKPDAQDAITPSSADTLEPAAEPGAAPVEEAEAAAGGGPPPSETQEPPAEPAAETAIAGELTTAREAANAAADEWFKREEEALIHEDGLTPEEARDTVQKMRIQTEATRQEAKRPVETTDGTTEPTAAEVQNLGVDETTQPAESTAENTPLRTAAEIATSGEPPLWETAQEQPATTTEANAQTVNNSATPQEAQPPVYDVATPDGTETQAPTEAAPEGQGAATMPQEAPSAPAQAAEATDTEKAAKIQALQDKIDSRTANADEIRELRDLKQDPDQRRQALEAKAKDGSISDQEAEELGKLNTAKTEQLTPEQQAQKLQKDIEDMGTELMMKATKGEEVTAEDLQKFAELKGQAALTEQGFTPDQARAAIKNMPGVKGGNERQTQALKEIQGKIQELMALELQLRTIPQNIQELRKNRDGIKQQAAAKHREVESAATPEQRLQLRGQEVDLYMRIATANQGIVSQKYAGDRINAKISDLEQYIRRRTDVTSGATAFVEWAGAKTRNVVTEAKLDVAEELSYRFGSY